MKFLILIILLSTSYVSHSYECLPSITIDQIDRIKDDVRDSYFPHLDGVEISISQFRSRAYFLQANFPGKQIIRAPLQREYRVEVNPKLLECPPSDQALRAILVHELKHIDDFIKMNQMQFLSYAAKYGLSEKFHISYERLTDLFALEQNQAEGLKEYRRWIYQRIGEKDQLKKRKYYYTPEEIEQWQQSRQ